MKATAKREAPQPEIARFVLERIKDGRYRALAVEQESRCWLVAARPGQVRTWAYLGPCIRYLEATYPHVEHYELRLRPSSCS